MSTSRTHVFPTGMVQHYRTFCGLTWRTLAKKGANDFVLYLWEARADPARITCEGCRAGLAKLALENTTP